MHKWLGVVLVLAAVACGKGGAKDEEAASAASEPKKSAEPSGGAEDKSEKDASAQTEPVVADSKISAAFSKAGLSLGEPALASWKLPDADPSFLGFSKDGRYYGVAESFGHEEMPGVAPFWVRFVEIRDIHTQKVVRAYQGVPFKDADWGDDVKPMDAEEKQAAKYWKSLPANNEADAELKRLGIKRAKPSRSGPDGATIEVEVKGRAPRGSRFKVKPEDGGFGFRWDKIKPAAEDDDPKKVYAPRIVVKLVRGAKKTTLVTVRPRTPYDEMQSAADTKNPYLVGEIRAHWGPQGRRVLISFSEEMKDQHEEYGSVGRVSNYIRAVGPQLKIIDAGVGAESARKVAALFEDKGLFVTAVETAKNPSSGYALYYRGESGKAAADAAAKLLADTRSEELTKGGWVDLIVVLGGPGGSKSTEVTPKEEASGTCALKTFDFSAHKKGLATQKQLAKIEKAENREYEGGAGQATPGPAVRLGKGFAFPMVDCDGSRCDGGIRVGKKWIPFEALTEGVDGVVEYHGIALADIDGDGARELVFSWSNIEFGDDGMDSAYRIAIVSSKTKKLQLVHKIGACSPFVIKTGPTSCAGGAQVVIECAGKTVTYQRPAKAAKYKKK